MSDELKTLHDNAAEARARADELNDALTSESFDEEREEARQAEQDAERAEKEYADAKEGSDPHAPKEGDPCVTEDGIGGVLQMRDGVLVCAIDAPADQARTDYAEQGARAGDACICPDGRQGTVHAFDAGLICIPNQVQPENLDKNAIADQG